MKSETYQKEGWSILEEENQVFGKNAEAVDDNENLESEGFIFYSQNKEEAKKDIDSSVTDLSDFIDSLIHDVPVPSEEEVNAGIERILTSTHPEEEQPKTVKNKKKKVTFKVLFVAALLSALLFCGIFAVGSSHDVSIENGFVTFTKDTIKIMFFGEEKEQYITVDALLTDLVIHGFGDILFPEEFVTKSDEYKVSVPEEENGTLFNHYSVKIYNDEVIYTYTINTENDQQLYNAKDAENAYTMSYNSVEISVFEFENGNCSIHLFDNGYHCEITSDASFNDMISLANTLKLIKELK